MCRRLTGLPAGLYASRSYLADRGMPTAANVRDHWFIDGIRAPRLARGARRLGYILHKDQFVFRSDHFAGRLNGAVAGWGISVVPVHVAMQQPELVRVLVDVPFTEVEMWLVARDDVRGTPHLRDAFATAGDMLNAFASELPGLQEAEAGRLRPKRTVSA